MLGDGFEWDEAVAEKASRNAAKHGVTFDEAARMFGYDPTRREAFDSDHSDDEDRYKAVGWAPTGKLLVVSFTMRGKLIRIISARELERWEEDEYVRGDFP